MAPIRLFVADVDGTLFNQHKALTPGVLAAVKRLRDAGVELAITSGRPPRGMAMLVEPLGLTTPIAAFNGGVFVQPDLTTIIEQSVFRGDVAGEAVDFMLKAGMDVWVYCGADWYVRDLRAPHVAHETSSVEFEPTVVRDLHDVLDGAVKLVGVSDDLPLVARVETELRQRVQAHASAARSQSYYLDVTHPNANKGMVVRCDSRRLQVPLDQIAAIGDMPSDVLMFGVAGMGIAMGNASTDVQRCARYVTRSNQEDGFAYAVDTFVLGQPGP